MSLYSIRRGLKIYPLLLQFREILKILTTSWALNQWKINYSIGKLEFEYLPKKLCDNGPWNNFFVILSLYHMHAQKS